MPVVLVAVIEYEFCFAFFRIVDQDGCRLVHTERVESIGIIVSLFLKGGDMEVGFLPAHSGLEV